MGLFNFFNKKNGTEEKEGDRVAESIFLQPGEGAPTPPVKEEKGIYFLYQFLEKNYQSQGYDDALMNPDNTNLQENILAIKNDLNRTIRKVKTYYEDLIRKTEFHISSRQRSGMVDVVEELQVEKETALSHMNQVAEIEADAARGEGDGQGLIISYTRGFRNGLAAISHHTIVNKNL